MSEAAKQLCVLSASDDLCRREIVQCFSGLGGAQESNVETWRLIGA